MSAPPEARQGLFSSSSGTAPNAASNPEDKNISDKKENVDIVAEVVLALLEKYNKIENIPDDELDGAVQEIVNYWEAKTSPDELARYQNDPGTLSINMKKPENNCREALSVESAPACNQFSRRKRPFSQLKLQNRRRNR